VFEPVGQTDAYLITRMAERTKITIRYLLISAEVFSTSEGQWERRVPHLLLGRAFENSQSQVIRQVSFLLACTLADLMRRFRLDRLELFADRATNQVIQIQRPKIPILLVSESFN
jgi:hypothetical protein